MSTQTESDLTLTATCPKCGAPAGDPCRTPRGKPKATCRERVARQAPTPEAPAPAPAPAPGPADFDESTPPPRRRPEGAALSRFVRLPAGEDLKAAFEEWDRAGRIPAGCILCESIGVWPFGEGKWSGYKLLAAAPPAVVRPLPGSGELADADLNGRDIVAEVRRGRDPQWYAVFAPEKPARAAAKGGA